MIQDKNAEIPNIKRVSFYKNVHNVFNTEGSVFIIYVYFDKVVIEYDYDCGKGLDVCFT